MAALDDIPTGDLAYPELTKAAISRRLWMWVEAHKSETVIQVLWFRLSWESKYIRAVVRALLGPCPVDVCS